MGPPWSKPSDGYKSDDSSTPLLQNNADKKDVAKKSAWKDYNEKFSTFAYRFTEKKKYEKL